MHDDEKLFRLGWIMLIIVGLIMSGLGICYSAQNKKIRSLDKEISESTSFIAKNKMNETDFKIKQIVLKNNPKARQLRKTDEININDIPLVEQ